MSTEPRRRWAFFCERRVSFNFWIELLIHSLTEEGAKEKKELYSDDLSEFRKVGEVFEIVEPTSGACELKEGK